MKELRELIALERKLKSIKERIERKLPAGYNLYGSTLNTMSHCFNDDLIPKEDRNILQKSSELLAIDKKKEGEQELKKLIKKYRIGE